MPIEILMPALSPTMKEGNLAQWLKKEGDKVSPGDVIAEIETDKATMEVEAVDEGTIGKIIVKAGTEGVAVNAVIALLLEEGEGKEALKSYKPAEKAVSEDTKEDTKEDEKKPKSTEKAVETSGAAIGNVPDWQVQINQLSQDSSAKPKKATEISASPVAKRIANNANIDLNLVKGTGPKGRIIKEDVLAFSENSGASALKRDVNMITAIPNNNIRKITAKRLLESKQFVPHFYLTIDCNISGLLKTRQEVNSLAIKDEHGKPNYKISVNDMVIKASALALKAIPAANASWSDAAILQYNNVDISIAVSTDNGLITPIVQNAEQKSIIAISNEMKSLAKKARAGALKPEEFQGGSFSISNLGMYGIKQFNAIINPPQSCILAVGSGEKRVVADNDGNIDVADIMSVTLSCDHRVVDGAVGAELLAKFKFYIENPSSLLL
jgi:pyruvate dehydrogenase E2 component (dihydrolipoamide acetyltransferase)